ncbi:MAG TPA: hypothetical protein VGP72_22125 [Planctomycetota bacterium]
MKMFRNFARRSLTPRAPATRPSPRPRIQRRLAAGILIALLSCLSGGCARRVSYVNSDHQLVRLEAGQPAPHAGVLMSEGYLSEIYEALGK